MDYNFSYMVNDALARGLSFEEIAANFTKTLNEIQKSYQEEDALSKYIKDISDGLTDWANTDGEATLSLAADMATLRMYDEHDDWSADRLRKFNEDAVDQLKALAELYEMEDKGDPYSLHVRCMLDAAKAAEKKVGECSKNEDEDAKADDAEILLRFLKSFGL